MHLVLRFTLLVLIVHPALLMAQVVRPPAVAAERGTLDPNQPPISVQEATDLVAEYNEDAAKYMRRLIRYQDEREVIINVLKFPNFPDLIEYIQSQPDYATEVQRIRIVNPYNKDSYTRYYSKTGERLGAIVTGSVEMLERLQKDAEQDRKRLAERAASIGTTWEAMLKEYDNWYAAREALRSAQIAQSVSTNPQLGSSERVFIDESASRNTPISRVGFGNGPITNAQPRRLLSRFSSNPRSPQDRLFSNLGLGGDRQRLLFTGDGRALRIASIGLSIASAAIGASSGGGAGFSGGVGTRSTGGFGGPSERLTIDERFGIR